MNVDGVPVGGNGLCDGNHPILCRLENRLKASIRMLGINGVRACWPSAGGSYLVSSLLVNAHSRDLSARSNAPVWAILYIHQQTERIGETFEKQIPHRMRKVPVIDSGQAFKSQRLRQPGREIQTHGTVSSLPYDNGNEGKR